MYVDHRYSSYYSIRNRICLFTGVGLVVLCLIALLSAPVESAGGVIYVDLNAAGANNGTSWKDAYTSLQSALDHSSPGDEIWAAQGVYMPALDEDRGRSFRIPSGVGVYGGFAGIETDQSERKWWVYPTILSGDIGKPGDPADNSYHVVTASEVGESTLLDGFTVTGGAASGSDPEQQTGGGIGIDRGSLLLSNLVFRDNTAAYSGGGIHLSQKSSLTLINVVFLNNSAGYGGAVASDQSSVTIVQATFYNNAAADAGHSLFNTNDSTAEVSNSIFWGAGSGQIRDDASSSKVSYSIIQGGYAGTGNLDADPQFISTAIGSENLRLKTTSPGVDAGKNEDVPVGVTTDLDGKARFFDVPAKTDSGSGTAPIVDMGAYETANVIFVNAAAAPGGDGTSWVKAYASLQDGLAAASADVRDEIWVAAGTYNPGPGRENTFALKSGVALYGGFTTSMTQRTQRDWQAHLTILTGEIGAPSGGDNSCHVVSAVGPGSSGTLDGFVLRDAFSSTGCVLNGGGGIYTVNSSPLLEHLTITANFGYLGGGAYFESSNAILADVTFSGNLSDGFGAGLFSLSSNLHMDGMKFLNNTAGGGGGVDGGGVIMHHGVIDMKNVYFSGNGANRGGGLYLKETQGTIVNGVFLGNSAANEGGAIYVYQSSPILINTTFYNNTSIYEGSNLLIATASHPVVTNSILREAGGIMVATPGDSTLTISYSVIYPGLVGVGNVDADPQFISITPGSENLRLKTTSPGIDAGNNAALSAGVTTDLDGKARFFDVPAVSDTGSGAAPIVDMGAYEAKNVIHVNAAAVPNGDGTSWASAYRSLQDGLANAAAGTRDEIWVAAGTYIPGTARESTFALKSGVGVYGGFTSGMTSRGQRSYTANVTILSGEIGLAAAVDNICHVVTASSSGSAGALDGFTIQRGYAVSACTSSAGGGIRIQESSPTLANLVITDNQAGYGGGLSVDQGNPQINQVTFQGNITNGFGGGAYLSNSPLQMEQVTFIGNHADLKGGGLYLSDCATGALTNAVLKSNSSGQNGGGIFMFSSSATLTHLTFFDNSPSNSGGNLFLENSHALLTNSIVREVGSLRLGNINSTLTVTYSIIYPGITGTGNIDADPQFRSTTPGSEDLRLKLTSPGIDAGNNAALPAGVTTDLDGRARFLDAVGIPDTGSGTAPVVDMGAYEAAAREVFLPGLMK